MAKYTGKTLAQMTPAQRASRVAGLIAAGKSSLIPDEYAPQSLLAKRTPAAKLANPGARSKLPDSALTPSLLALRNKIALEKDPSHIQAVADARETYDPQISALTQTQSQVPGWYQAYQDQIAKASAATQAADQAAQTEIQSRSAPGAQPMVAQNNQAITQAQADAALRGAILDPQAATRAENAAAVNQAGVNNFANVLSALKASDVSVGGTEGVAAASGLTATQKALAAQLASVKGQKAAHETSEYQQLSSQAKKDAATQAQADFTNQIAAATLGVKTTTAKSTAALDAAKATKLSQPSVSDQKTALEIAYFNKHGYWPSTKSSPKSTTKKPASGPGSLSSSAEQKQLSTVLKVAQALQNGTYQVKVPVTQYGQTTTVTKNIKGEAAIVRQLKAENVDPRVIRAAVSVYRNKGAVGPDGVAQLHKLGIHVGGNFKVVK